MIHSLSLSPVGTASAHRPLLPALAAPWPPTLLWTAGIALCLSVALASLPRSAWTPGSDGSLTITDIVGPVELPAILPASARGVVEAIRRIEPADLQAAGYAFTVRLRDGSTRESTVDAATASAWAVGDRIMLVGGV